MPVLANGADNQLDGGATAGTPNAFPDFMTKMAWDMKPAGHSFHLEAGGILTSAKVAVLPAGVNTFKTHLTLAPARVSWAASILS